MIAGIISEKPVHVTGFSASSRIELASRNAAESTIAAEPRPLTPETVLTQPAASELRRAGYFAAVLLIVNAVGDGWSGRPGGLQHQLLLLPFLVAFCLCASLLLRNNDVQPLVGPFWNVDRAAWLCVALQASAILLFLYEGHHFTAFAYHLSTGTTLAVFAPLLVILVAAASQIRTRPPILWLAAVTACSIAGFAVAVTHFPLIYLRSDMLPVILWADTNLLHHVDPYATMHVGARVYDFPYLPGMIVAYLPFVAAHVDIRWGSLFYLLASAALIFSAARKDRRSEVAMLIGLFLLQPFLQYRHDLYLEPHWLTMVAAYALMQRRHFAWSAFVFGISMAIYQFSWILFPFFLLNAFRRKGWPEALKLATFTAAGALVIAGPFLSSAFHRIAHNTVGQWGAMGHALADPINLSYWATFVIRPDKLLRLQAVLMVAIFAWAFAQKRCTTLADTLRCSTAALTVFILFNSIVDGYFYLMLLIPMLLYVCAANGWWAEPADKLYSV